MLFRRRKAGSEDAQKALEEAHESLRKVQKRSKEVSAISNALKEMRERNHFSEQMEEIFVRYGGSP